MTSSFESMKGREKHPLTEFYQRENIEQKTELERDDIKNIMEIEYIDEYFRTIWGVDLKLKETITIPFESKMVSHKRKGRIEGMEVMKAQEVQVGTEAHTRSMVDRMLGR